jgi:outer membrane protein
MLRIWIIGLFFVCSLMPSVVAQQSWTLDRCISYAWDNNLSIKNQALDVKIQKANLSQAGNNLLPSLGAQASMTEYYGRSIDPNTNSYIDVQFFDNSYGLYSTIELFAGFMKINQIAFEKYTFQAVKNQLQQVKNEVALEVINGYFDLLLKEGLRHIAWQNFDLSREQRDYTATLVELGRKAGTDLLELEATVAADSFLLVQAAHLLEQAELNLKYQMNYPVEQTLDVDTVLFSQFTQSMDTLQLEEVFSMASMALPNMKVMENQLLASKKALQIRKGDFSPKLDFYAGWSSNYATTIRDLNNNIIPFRDQIGNNGSEYLSFGLDIPLFSRLSRFTALKKSRLEYHKAKVSYDDESYKLKMVVEKSLTDWHSAKAAWLSAQKQLVHSTKAFEAAQKKLEKGMINIIDFDIQKNKVFIAKTEVLRTGLEVLLKENYIRFLMTGEWLIDNG